MNHKKKLLATAVAGALAIPSAVALAQTSTVQIGGSITAFYYRHSPDNPSISQSGDIMETSEPEMYVRGEEKLGGGLSAWFQCTSSLDGMIQGAGSAFGLCGRNSGIGFQGSWGNAFLGNWDSPEKLVFNRLRSWWGGTNSLTGGSAVLMEGGTASGLTNPTNGTGSGAFFRRQAESFNYHSPSWNGFSFNGAFSAGNESTGFPETNPLSPRMYSLAAQYSSGPLYVGVGYERHNDYNPGVTAVGTCAASNYCGGTDDHWIVVAGYTFGAFNIRGGYADTEYETTNTTTLKTKGWGLFADWNIQGPHTLRGMYVNQDDSKGTSGINVGSYKGPAGLGCGATSTVSCASSTGGKQWGLAYSYAFSKRTMGSFVYTKMDNDSGGSFSRGKVASTAGNSQTSTGFVLQHRF